MVAALVAALLAAGCNSGSHDPKMTVTYEKASTGPAIVGRAMMTRTHMLDHVADKINHTLDLPYDIALVGAQCGEANAFWNLAEKKITICYEDADLSLRAFKAAGDSDPIPAAVNAEIATFYHEFAHAAIDFDELPITGREEDASDQLVVFLLLEPDENGNIEPVAEEGDAPDLSSVDSWVHTSLALNVLGRTKPNPPKTNDAGEEVPDENAPEPSVPLKPIGDDAQLADGEGGSSWEVRVGPVSGLPEGEAPKGVTVLRSLRFPGAVTVGVGKKSTSLYVGYGHEVSLKAYAPALPPKLPEEFDFTAEDKRVKEKADVTVEPKVEAPEE